MRRESHGRRADQGNVRQGASGGSVASLPAGWGGRVGQPSRTRAVWPWLPRWNRPTPRPYRRRRDKPPEVAHPAAASRHGRTSSDDHRPWMNLGERVHTTLTIIPTRPAVASHVVSHSSVFPISPIVIRSQSNRACRKKVPVVAVGIEPSGGRRPGLIEVGPAWPCILASYDRKDLQIPTGKHEGCKDARMQRGMWAGQLEGRTKLRSRGWVRG